MKLKQNKDEVFYWGSILFKTSVKEEHLNKVKDLCHKNTKLDYSKFLVGDFDSQFQINHNKYDEIISDYLIKFKVAFYNYYGFDTPKFKINDAWVNYMKDGDFNPEHMHPTFLSSVLFLQVPDDLKTEREKYKGNFKNGGAGCLTFTHPDNNDSPYIINERTFRPEEGDLFVFPGTLKHFVWPFKSKVERISVAANWGICK